MNVDFSETVDIPIWNRNHHLNKQFHPYIRAFARNCVGTVLDIGCGTKPHMDWFEDVDEYIGLDVYAEGNSVDFLASGMELPVQSNSIDYVVSTQVLEHLPDPSEFFTEVHRVLKAGGQAFISTNQMYPLHEIPNDYFRFTRYGLRELTKSSGMIDVGVVESGNLMTRVCCELNYTISEFLPSPFSKGAIAIVNLISELLTHLEHREDYIVTAILTEKPDY
ncbi:bifunctional 2-polyprenyl-6-hydroxyphenol methylase/3-demethylubiquinol 3-O-methyltransferase UbiG [Haladaptatus sp. YSMS36]|uniref:class I SAM-dependent methyltransferase n=1 Tax=Haladaptatus sp. YSMS36 TaxID=3033384 RepID=UPI0023E8DD68|nr:class I SAM-dependent methyltransferase [Haladaptatus sp. YSMS36]